MTREMLLEKSLEDLREIARAQGVKSITKYRKAELADIIMNGGKLPGSAEAEPELPAPQPAIDTSRQPEPKVTAAPEAPTPRQNTDTEAAASNVPTPAELRGGYTPSYNQRQQNTYQRGDNRRTYDNRNRNAQNAQRVNNYAPRRNDADSYPQNDYRMQPENRQQDYGYNRGGDYQRQQNGYYQQSFPAPDYRNDDYHQGYIPQSGYNQSYRDSDYRYRSKPEGYYNPEYGTSNPAVSEMIEAGECYDISGILEICPEGFGFLRTENYFSGNNDIYVSNSQIKRFHLRTGDQVEGKARSTKENGRYVGLMYISAVNGIHPEESTVRKSFDELVPIFPDERLTLESPDDDDGKNLAIRLIDLMAPIGKGQRGMIVSQPKAGKTTLLKAIASGIEKNYPDVHLIVLLIDERPEEVTDMKRSIKSEVVYSTFDELPEHHTKVSEMVLERAMRLVEIGRDVVILMDSITRLSRAYNLTIGNSGKTLSGGMDPGALHKPKRFFGAARNIENGGSLTVIATALIETGSRMDDMIYEEFKGTGNMEIHLDRKLSERRIFPAIDIYKSGTRRDDLLLTPEELNCANSIRRMMASGNNAEVTERVINSLEKTKDNNEFIQRFKGIEGAYEKEGFFPGGRTIKK